MQIFLRGKATYVVNVEKTDTVLHIKKLIFEKEQIPAPFLLLQWNTRCLEDAMTLEHYNIERDSTIYFRVRAIVLSDTSDVSENAPTSCDSPAPE
jgi:hypothetical protein